MLVSIFADYSFCHKTKANGFGAYIKSDRGQLEYSGSLKEPMPSTVEGEYRSCVNAIFIALKSGILKPGDTVLIQNDNLESVRRLKLGFGKKLNQVTKKNRLKILAKHVKGHSGYISRRHSANEICDSLAKKAMKKQRAEIGGHGNG